jgi:RNA polymerase sigma factor (sigma-70 family)
MEELDPGALQEVQAYLDARAARRAPEPAWVLAWDRFFATYDPLIRRLVSRRARRIGDRDDQVQEIWTVVVARLCRYDRQRGPFCRWLRAVGGHVLDDCQRAERRSDQLDVERAQRLLSREGDPASACESHQVVDALIQALHSCVSEGNFQIAYRHLLAGESYEAIAATIGLTVGQVRDRHRRAMRKLRGLLLKRGRGKDTRVRIDPGCRGASPACASGRVRDLEHSVPP